MSDWRENANGNYVYVMGLDDVMTVFKRDDGLWSGVYQDRLTRQQFNTAEEAMEAMAPIEDGNLSILRPSEYHGWKPTRDGKGFYRRGKGYLATVKRTMRGTWFVTVDSHLWEGQWFATDADAKAAADQYCSALPTGGRTSRGYEP